MATDMAGDIATDTATDTGDLADRLGADLSTVRFAAGGAAVTRLRRAWVGGRGIRPDDPPRRGGIAVRVSRRPGTA